MRFKIIFSLLLSGWVLIGNAQSARLKINVNYYQPYCGGARPTPEMEADAQKPKPYASRVIIIVSESGKVDSAKTNAAGVLSVRLKYGNYKLYEAWRYYKKTPGGEDRNKYDSSCLETEWKKEIFVIKRIKKGWDVKEANPVTLFCDWAKPCFNDTSIQVPE